MRERRLFVASCLALIATSMAFSIRADIIPALKTDFGFTDSQMGLAAGPGLWGFAITIVLGGMIVDFIGMKALLYLAFAGHVAGTVLTIFSTGFTSLWTATLLIGLANGTVEAVTNPLVATLFPESKTKHLNILHAWWPGGLILGGLLSYAITKGMGIDMSAAVPAALLSLSWKIKMALILIPTLLYGYLIFSETFPVTERVATGVSVREMFGEAFRPLFLLFVVLMMMTAATELGPDQWVGNLLQNLVGIQGVLLLVYTAGIMFVLRQFFAGALVQRFSPIGLLAISSLITAAGLWGLGSARTAFAVFAAATLFGFGKTFFWPTMVGVVAERFPRGGALLMGIIGGAGMFSVGWLMAPIMGQIQDHYSVQSLSSHARTLVVTDNGLDERKVAAVTDPAVKTEIDEAKQYSATMTYRWVTVLPILLTIIFTTLYFYFASRGGYRAVILAPHPKLT